MAHFTAGVFLVARFQFRFELIQCLFIPVLTMNFVVKFVIELTILGCLIVVLEFLPIIP